MTHAEWLAADGPWPMLEFMRASGRLSDRKARLFAVACCRRTWHLMPDKRSRHAVKVAERYAEGSVGSHVLNAAHRAVFYSMRKGAPAEEWARAHAQAAAREATTDSAERAAVETARRVQQAQGWSACARLHAKPTDAGTAYVAWKATFDLGCVTEGTTQASLARDLFGPFPFRRVAVEDGWLTWNEGTIAKLTEAIYQERAFDRLPVLADALEEAGCTNAEILSHCRGPGPHVRGCWVLDLLLGKE